MHKERVISQTEHTNPAFRVESWTLAGELNKKWYVIKNDAAGCVVSYKDMVALVEVERPMVRHTSFEIPAGRIELNETPHNAALREVLEETGLSIEDASLLWSGLVAPSYSSEKLFIFEANIDSEEPLPSLNPSPSDEKIIACRWFTRGEVESLYKCDRVGGIDYLLLSLYFNGSLIAHAR